ncbi:hypothetical protein BKA82DRAFT_4023824 [Pisolithus tinctorius]|nr:hypothetical protein BKA82DRAFT_4023824 [Pisolithus tinctorius]
MMESQGDFPLESFSHGASVVNEGLDPTPFAVAAGDDETATHGDIPPVADDPPANKRSGRDPRGRQKGKGVATTKEFITTQLLQSQKSSGTPQMSVQGSTPSPEHCLKECGRFLRCLVHLTLPNRFASTNTQTQITLDSEEVATFLKTIPGVVRSLAKGCKDRAEGINEQFKQFFLNLRAISKVHGQKVTDVFSHLKATNEMHRMLMADAAYLGLHLQKMESMEDTVIDINVKKGYLILANQSGLGMKKNA